MTTPAIIKHNSSKKVPYLFNSPAIKSNVKVSDGSQPPMALNLPLSESAGSRSLHRLVLLVFGHLGSIVSWRILSQ
jgi:hypothetical protein